MASNKHLIGQGIGFSPGTIAFIVRDGLGSGAEVVVEDDGSYNYAMWQLYQKRRKERELRMKIGRDFEDVLLL